MVDSTNETRALLPENSDNLSALPFKYERTEDISRALFVEKRVNPVLLNGKPNLPKTDEDILQDIRDQQENKAWYTNEYWRKKGVPKEQIDFMVGNQPITVYNWNGENLVTDEYAKKIQEALEQLAVHFPQAIDKLRWILMDDVQAPSAFGDSKKYPFNGVSLKDWAAFRFFPRGISLIPHRIEKTTNVEGTLVHEVSHSIEDNFFEEWKQRYRWEYCVDHIDDWESRLPPEGDVKRWFNKQTGEMAPQSQYPLQPEECVTDYAKLSREEDICDSIVAYIYDPDLLKGISPTKFDILRGHDAKRLKPVVSLKRVAKEDIRLPEIKPETIYYYIKEPKSHDAAGL